ncbi:YcxB family protein [Neisseria sp. Ec49-e6-T10]|uniref:YcxB family protein n=1 Tax=Neisseria sp. Ec49-e6-T10 TaxID=3140744 RepID=UPI003EBB97BF
MQPLTINNADLIAINRLNWLRNFRVNKRKLLSFELGFLILFGVLISIYYFLALPIVNILLCGLVLLLLLPMMIAFNWFVFIPILASKYINRNKILSKPYTVRWDDTYLYISSEETKSQLAWSVFFDMIQNDEYILLYSQDYVFQVIAKRFFDSTKEMNDFLRRVQKVINKK